MYFFSLVAYFESKPDAVFCFSTCSVLNWCVNPSWSTQRLESPISLSVHPESKSGTKSWRCIKLLIIRRWADSLIVPDECWCCYMSAGFLNQRCCAQQMSHLNIRQVSLLMSGSSLKSPQRFHFVVKSSGWRHLADVSSRIQRSLIKAELGKLSKALSSFPPLPLLQPL